MMCYKHPNGLRSILKYPGVLCGTADHDMMLVMGWILLTVFVLGFVALCTFAVSPLINLPVVLATDFPPIQVVCIAMVLTTMMVLQMLSWPWKVPMLNLTDCTVGFCIVLLVTTSTLYLNVIDETMYAFASIITTAMLSGIAVAIGIMVCMTVAALFHRAAMGGKKELKFFNLGSVPSSWDLSKKVKALVGELEAIEFEELKNKLNGLAVFDMNKITTCITLMATEVAPPAEDALTFKFNLRIAASSFDPALKKKPQSLRESAIRTEKSNTQEVVEVEDPNDVTQTGWV
eukprot:symbB.v1.2.014958.t1/scaffold1058.1/size194011/5